MADDAQKEYKGPGKFTSTIGRAVTENLVLSAIGSALGFLVMRKDPMKGAKIGATIGGAIGFGHGGYKGYEAAKDAKEQFETTQTQLEEQRGFVARLTEERQNASKARSV